MDYPLEERTFKFGKNAILACKGMKLSVINEPIIKQLIRSATSVGANYSEANGASSKSDFRNKIHICKKEAQESRHWLRLLAETESQAVAELKKLAQEAHELSMIFGKIAASTNRN